MALYLLLIEVCVDIIPSDTNVTIYNHLLMVYGENAKEINMIHVEANNTKGIESIDNPTISGSHIFVNNSIILPIYNVFNR